jgi:pimeloyl-ACP methyl ester carboxylesterase
VMGWSCGGPYAAVCGARMSDRITAVGLLSSAVPFELVGTTKGLARDDRILLYLVRQAPRLASALLRVTIGEASETRLYREIRRSFPAVDRAALAERGSIVDAVAFVKESMRQGPEGCIQDYRVFGDPWGFDLSEVTMPVQIWEGAEDVSGPPEYRELLLRHLPQAQLSIVPGEGHLSLLQHQAPTILSHLTSPVSG